MRINQIITCIVAAVVLTVVVPTMTFGDSPRSPRLLKIDDPALLAPPGAADRGCETYYYYDDTATSLAAFMIPDVYGDDLYNTRFTVEKPTCTLTTAWILMYGGYMTGTPGMRIYLWDDDGTGFPGNKLDSADIGYTELPTGLGWVGADFSAAHHLFNAGEEFHIGWTLIGGTGDTLCCVSDWATGPHSGEERCSEYRGGAWHTILDDWGADHIFLMEADVCCSPPGEVTVWTDGPGAGTGGTIIADQPVTFNVHFNNNTGENVVGSTNGFRLHSPEGATWQVPAYASTGELEVYYDLVVAVNGFSVDGINDDTIGIGGTVMMSPGLPPGFDEDVLTISTQVAAAHAGSHLCIDSSYYPPSGVWLWAIAAKEAVIPAWGGPYCYEIVVDTPIAGEITSYISGPGAGTGNTIIADQPVTFNIHYNNTTGEILRWGATGFRLYSPESATWQAPTSASTGELEPYWDMGVFLTELSIDGLNDDTIGIGGLALIGGVPVAFDEDVMTITTQVAATHAGKNLCIDSTWYPPSNLWLWGLPDNEAVFPAWGGPYCYEIVVDTPVAGEVSVYLSGPGAGTGDTIVADQPVTFNVHFYNNTGQNVTGSTNGFRLHSPEGATWQVPAYASTGELEVYYDLVVAVNGFSVDGINDDTIGIGGCVMVNPGLPPGFDEDVLTISTQVAAAHAGSHLCIDSSYYPPSGVWLWATAAKEPVLPAWGGPYCYSIIESVCDTIMTAFGLEHAAIGTTCLELEQDLLRMIQDPPDYYGGASIDVDEAMGWEAKLVSEPEPETYMEQGMAAYGTLDGVTEQFLGSWKFVIDDTSAHFVVDYGDAESYTMEVLLDGEVVYVVEDITDSIPPIVQVPTSKYTYYPPEDKHLDRGYHPSTPDLPYRVVLAATWWEIEREFRLFENIFVWADDIRFWPKWGGPAGPMPGPDEWLATRVDVTVAGMDTLDIEDEEVIQACAGQLEAFGRLHRALGPVCVDSVGGGVVLTTEAPEYTGGVAIELDSVLNIDIECGLIPMPIPPGRKLGLLAMVETEGGDPYPAGHVIFNITEDTNYFHVDFNGVPYDIEFIHNGEVVHRMENLTDTVPPVYQITSKEFPQLPDELIAGIDPDEVNTTHDWSISHKYNIDIPEWMLEVIIAAEMLRFIPKEIPWPWCPPICPPDPWDLGEVHVIMGGIDSLVIETEVETPAVFDTMTYAGLFHETGGWTELDTVGDALVLTNNGPHFAGEVSIQTFGAARWDAAIATDPNPQPAAKLGLVTPELGSASFVVEDTAAYFVVDLEAPAYDVRLLLDGEVVYTIEDVTDPIPPIRQVPSGGKAVDYTNFSDIHSGPNGYKFTLICIGEILWEILHTMQMPGDAVEIIPKPGPDPEPEFEIIQVVTEGYPTVEIHCESTVDEALMEAPEFGLYHQAAGLATLDTIGQGMRVYTGCSGYPGAVSISVGQASGWLADWETMNTPTLPVPPPNKLGLTVIGDTYEQTGVPFGGAAFVIEGDSNYFDVEMDALYYSLELRQDGESVCRVDSITGPVPPIRQVTSRTPGGELPGGAVGMLQGAFVKQLGIVFTWDDPQGVAWEIEGSGPYYGNEVELDPEGGPFGPDCGPWPWPWPLPPPPPPCPPYCPPCPPICPEMVITDIEIGFCGLDYLDLLSEVTVEGCYDTLDAFGNEQFGFGASCMEFDGDTLGIYAAPGFDGAVMTRMDQAVNWVCGLIPQPHPPSKQTMVAFGDVGDSTDQWFGSVEYITPDSTAQFVINCCAPHYWMELYWDDMLLWSNDSITDPVPPIIQLPSEGGRLIPMPKPPGIAFLGSDTSTQSGRQAWFGFDWDDEDDTALFKCGTVTVPGNRIRGGSDEPWPCGNDPIFWDTLFRPKPPKPPWPWTTTEVVLGLESIDTVKVGDEPVIHGIMFGLLPNLATGDALISLAGTGIHCYNVGTQGTDGIVIPMAGSERMATEFTQFDPHGLPVGSNLTHYYEATVDGIPDQSIGAHTAAFYGDSMTMTIDYGILDIDSVCIEAYVNDSLTGSSVETVPCMAVHKAIPLSGGIDWRAYYPIIDIESLIVDYRCKTTVADEKGAAEDTVYEYRFVPYLGTRQVIEGMTSCEITGAGVDSFTIIDESTAPPTCCNHDGMRGDVNYDSEGPNIVDLTSLVAYLFGGGPAPPCEEEGNVNGDPQGAINIVDLTYLVAYLFGGGPPPLGCMETADSGPPAARAGGGITLSATYENGITTIAIESPVAFRGVQIDLAGDGSEKPVKLVEDDIELYFHQAKGSARAGVLDSDGSSVIESGTRTLFTIRGEYEITGALVSDLDHEPVVPAIGPIRKGTGLPQQYALHQNYPNPFNPVTTISFNVPEKCDYTLTIYNMLGQQVTQFTGTTDPGTVRIEWDAARYASGVYLYRLDAGSFSDTKKMVLMK